MILLNEKCKKIFRKRAMATPHMLRLIARLGVLIMAAKPALAQPTFPECKIFLIASDTARDLSLNRDPEYVRFLNLVARTFRLATNFDSYDNLPSPLLTTYKAYAWTEDQEIDISAAMFGAPATDDQLLVLQAFCNQTTEYIASLVEKEVTLSPTVTPKQEATPAPSAPLSFDIDSNDNEGLLMSSSSSVSELPIQCRRAMFGSDANQDGFLNEFEYKTFVNRITANAYAHAGSFDELPQELQKNFHRLADQGLLKIFGAIPSQWEEAPPIQRQFLQLICYRTEGALIAAHEAEQNQTASPSQTPKAKPTKQPHHNQTEPPSSGTANPSSAANVTAAHYGDASENHKKPNKNAIVAIVGSILVSLLGIYLARDKSEFFKSVCTKYRLRRFRFKRRTETKRASATTFDDESKTAAPTEALYDVESLQEQTGFLEDHRVGAGALASVTEEECNEANSIAAETIIDGLFEPVRHNLHEFTEPKDDEEIDHRDGLSSFDTHDRNVMADDFQNYCYDSVSDEHSDNMSLYCNSVPGECNRNEMSSKKDEKETSEFASPRRSFNTLYHASRFCQIAESEAKTDSARSSVRSTGSLVVDGRRVSASRRSTLKSSGRGEANQDSRSARRPRKVSSQKKKWRKARQSRRVAPVVDSFSCSSSDDDSPMLKMASQPEQALKNREPKNPEHMFLSYARDGSDEKCISPISTSRSGTVQYQKMTHVKQNPHTKSRQRITKASFESSMDFSDSERSKHLDYLDDLPLMCEEPKESMTATKVITGHTNYEDRKEADYESDSSSSCCLSEDFPDPATDLETSPSIPSGGQHKMRALLNYFRGRESELLVQTLQEPLASAESVAIKQERLEQVVPAKEEGKSNDSNNQESASTTSSASESSEFDDLTSKDDSREEIINGDSDSTYEGSDSDTSSTIPVESSESEKPDKEVDDSMDTIMAEIKGLVVNVMPTEQNNIPRMLEQYKGREEELLNTLRRLKIRMEARRASGRPMHVASSERPEHEMAAKIADNKAILKRASVVAENAQLLAAAAAALEADPGGTRFSQQVTFMWTTENESAAVGGDGTSTRSDEETSGRILDLETSSSEMDDEEFSEDSTYFEDQKSTGTHETWSVFSVFK